MSVQRPTLGRIWSSKGSRSDPGAEKYALGWTAEIPTYEVLNFLQHKTDLTLLATAQRGVPEWGRDVTYELGAVAWDNTDNTVYRATVPAPNNSLEPSKNPAQWEVSAMQFTASTHMALSKKIDDHITDKENPHKVTVNQVGTYDKPTIDNKINKVSGDTSAHVNNVNNPHGVTAAQAGGVPVTGGRYTGAVGFDANEVPINAQTGDFSILAEEGSLALRNKTAKLAIHADGSASANGIKLINEQQYPDVRSRDEHLYAVPVPDCFIDISNDIHLKQGQGFSEFTRPTQMYYTSKSGVSKTAKVDEPRFMDLGVGIGPYDKERLTIDAEGNIAGFAQFTIAIGFTYTGHACSLYRDNSGRADEIGVTDTGLPYVTIYDVNGNKHEHFSKVAFGYGDRVSVVLVVTGHIMKFYVNGVLQAKQDIAFAPTTSYTKIIMGDDKYFDTPVCGACLRSFRTWNQALTAEQISTL